MRGRIWSLLALLVLVLRPTPAAAQWETPSRAFHKSAAFPLEGRHLTVPCASCHIKGQIQGTPVKCFDCHWVRRQDDPYRTRLGMSCEQCHKPTSWTAVSWDHGTATGMPLNGAHRTLSCDTCHRNMLFTTVTLTCGTCHQRDYDAARTPDHRAAGFPTACELCHKPSDPTFAAGRFDHNSVFRLVGLHATAACTTCHVNGVYRGTPTDCVGCHRADYQRTTTPNHASAGFPTTCDQCHRATDPGWTTATFNHNQFFTLSGVHATADCTACHVNGVYKGTPTDCVGCHRSDYDKTTAPNHAAAGMSTDCASCHKATDPNWGGTSFNHNQFYPLVGLHATQTCAACHANGAYKGTPTDCYSCHRAQYDHTTSPNHASAGFSTACDSCHKATDPGWLTAGFNHSQYFALVGVHATQACTACHLNGVYKGTPMDCIGCHRNDYDRTSTPNHASAGFGTTCDSCHKATDPSWTTATFNHSQYFALVGVHATQACTACHINGVYKGTSTTCVGCHKNDYDHTTSPNHASAGFPTTCDSCHKATDPTWAGPTFNHSQFYPLVGVHATQTCASCHVNAVYHGTPTDCYSCHRAVYDASQNPNHAAAGFATTCDSCHKATDPNWLQATLNHNQWYPLVGQHALQQCSRCHVNNVYKGTPTLCVACHQTQYNQTTNPNHAAAGFPTTCDTCHKATDADWTLGTFNHTWFPITSGRHSGNPCSACHTNPANYAVFACTTACHDRTSTDSHHHGVNGYVYDSNRCYACHPTGRAG